MTSSRRSSNPFSNPLGVIDAIFDGELETVQTYLELYPDCHKLKGTGSNNILHFSIILEQCYIFDYLLTLDKIDLSAYNGNGQTPLTLSLDESSEYYSSALIKNGANVHQVCYNNNTLLHLALLKHKFITARLLLEYGADINAQNDDGCTPLHMLFHLKTDPGGVGEGVGLMMYYGADATIVDDQGNIPFELAVLYNPYLISVHESLFFYTFDGSSNYTMSLEVLIELLEAKSRLFLLIADYVSDVVFVKSVFLAPLTFFTLELEFLNVLINKFDYIITEIFNGPMVSWSEFKPSFLENCEILLNSHLAVETVQFIGKLNMDWIIDASLNKQISSKEALDIIFYLLTYGIKIYDRNFETVYKTYGYGELFKLLLLMDIDKGYVKADIVPRIFYDLDIDLETFLLDPHNYSLNAIESLMDYFARPKLKKFGLSLGANKVVNKAINLPDVPLLVEYARDASRKLILDRYNVQKPKDYFYAVKRLPIGRIHQKILSFESKLYW